MYINLVKLTQVVNATFPIIDYPTFKGSHSIILDKSGTPSLLIWYQHQKGQSPRAYNATLDEFDWVNIESEFAKMKQKIAEQEEVARVR